MPWWAWVLVIWVAVAVVAALVLGAAIRIADRHEATDDDLGGPSDEEVDGAR
ncbi:hypothetical protein [Geodermatophilus sp. SYSU D01119]